MPIGPTRRAVLSQGLTFGGLVAGAVLPARNLRRGAHQSGPISPAMAAEGAPLLCGVNLAGADFGALPGLHGREYLYPPSDNIAAYARQGFRVIRLPFKWERLQPDLGAPFEAGEQDRLVRTVQAALTFDLHAILDPHNYAK